MSVFTRSPQGSVDTGLDRLVRDPSLNALRQDLRSARVALLAHPASVTKTMAHVLDVLRVMGAPPRVLFGPEHGWAGEAQDMVGVGDDAAAGADRPRVVSLYGDSFSDLTPKKEHLEGIDVVVIDLQDVGARYYTYIWTAVLVARACHKHGVRVVVLDRPNPLGLDRVEGKLQEANYLSFVGLEPIPIRHGLTLGQIVGWRARVEGFESILTIVGARGAGAMSDRRSHATAWDRPFVMPSPNMPTYDTALVYPGGCLLEGTNLSEGRGTTRPFEIVGAPWLDERKLARDLEATRLPGFIARPISFEPTFHKHARTSCRGVQIHPTDPQVFRPVATYTALIALAHQQDEERFAFRTEKYEFVDNIPAFDLLTGSDRARKAILAKESPRDIAELVSAVGPAELGVLEEARRLRK